MSWNDPVNDIHRKLQIQRDIFLVGLLGTRLVPAVMVGYEGHRTWINYLAVAPDLRKNGFGPRLMEEAEACLGALGCPKVNLLVIGSNADVIELYEKIGYSKDDVISMGKRIEEDS